MKAWQRGYPLEELQRLTGPFHEHDAGLTHGAYTRAREADVAYRLERGQVLAAPSTTALWRPLTGARPIRDYRGEVATTLPAGTALVDRLGYRRWLDEPAELLAGLAARHPHLACWLWQEHRGDQALAQQLGLQLLAVKIRASSEVLGLYGTERLKGLPLPPLELAGLWRLALPRLPTLNLMLATHRLSSEWAQHYSPYNARGSWSALALRGFGGRPDWIEKPAEMSRKWRAEHPERLAQVCVDTPLRAQLPEAERLIAAIPGPKERVRLMRLTPGGELTRHADTTDPDAGSEPGQLLRIHIPLSTTPSCQFTSWGPLGEARTAHMGEGEAWWLDTRKPHACQNPSGLERLHLVVDTWATRELLALIGTGAVLGQRQYHG